MTEPKQDIDWNVLAESNPKLFIDTLKKESDRLKAEKYKQL